MSRSSGATGMIARNDKTLPRLDSLSMFGPYCASSTGFLSFTISDVLHTCSAGGEEKEEEEEEAWKAETSREPLHASYNHKWYSTFH